MLGHYQLGELLGQGGIGQLPAARRRSGRAVVIKCMRNTPSSDQLLAARLVLRALERSPDARHPSVTAFAAALDAALVGRPGSAIPAGSDLWRNPTQRGLAPTRAPAPFAASLALRTACLAPQAVGRHAVAGSQDPADAIISKALASAQRMIGGHRLAEAAQVLETARAALALALAVDADAPGCSGAWRLETVLAALYDTTGKQDRARRMALVAYRHAVRSGCELAEARARKLVDRVVRSRRIARGTAAGAP